MTDTSAYKQMLEDAGVPTTDAAIQAQWDKVNEESEVQIANDSNWSPFWRLISAIVTTPAKWLVTLLIEYALPNMFLKHAKGKWLDLLAWAVDLERKAATPVEGLIRFTRETSEGELTVEAGILVATPDINGTVYRVVTSEAVTIADGTISASIPVHGEKAGSEYNLGAGYFSVLPEAIPGIASVINEIDWITTEGADEETDEELRLRSRNQFSAVGQYHHDAAYRADIASFAGIRTDYITFEHGAPRGPGTANAYIMIDSGAPTQSFVDEINDYIQTQGHHGHGDGMLCMPIPVTEYALAATVYHDSNLSDDDITALQTGVENIIRYVFRENQAYEQKMITRTMPMIRFSFSKLDQELHNQLPNLQSVSFSLEDIIPSQIDLPVLSSLTVTMETA